MPWEKPKHINPDPEFSSYDVTGAQMDEPFVMLMGRYIDSLTIDGYRITSVAHMNRQKDGSMLVSCIGEAGLSHLFSYHPVEDGPVNHLLLETPEEQ